jgi:hypothetical protein
VFHQSPKGRLIQEVEGNPEDISNRGQAITDLGEAMREAAGTLQQIKDQGVGGDTQRGKAIESLKESVGDAHSKLFEAADLYEPVGPIIKAYGDELALLQPKINTAAGDAWEKWQHYSSLPGDKDGNLTPEAGGGFLGMGGYDADSPEAQDKADENQAKKDAFEAWEEVAEDWDEYYDSWSAAFETACDGIEEKVSGQIEDSMWSTFADVLGWVALVVGVVALIVGGPIAAAVALFVGALYLIATIKAYQNDERSGTDIALAAFSIIPIGKVSGVTKLLHLAKLGKGANVGKILGAATGLKNLKGLTTALKTPLQSLTKINRGGLGWTWRHFSKGAAVRQFFTGSRNGFDGILRNHRLLYNEGIDLAAQASRQSNLTKFLAGLDTGAVFFATNLRNYGYLDRLDKMVGGDTVVPNVPKETGFVF